MVCSVCIILEHASHDTKPYEHQEEEWKKKVNMRVKAYKSQIELLEKMESILDFTKIQIDKETMRVLQEEKKKFGEKCDEYYSNVQKSIQERSLLKTTSEMRSLKKLPKTPSQIRSPKPLPKVPDLTEEIKELKEDENSESRVPFDQHLILANVQKRLKDPKAVIEMVRNYYNENINFKLPNYDYFFTKFYNQALFFKSDKKFQESLDACDKILAVQKNDLATLSLKAQVLDKMKKNDQAKVITQQILNSPVLDLNDLFGYGETLFMQNQAEGFLLISEAASRGCSYAQNRLAFIYFSGEYVKKDKKTALYWFQKSADQGNAISQFNYGYSVMSGEGVPANQNEGLKYIKLSAKQGYSNAEYRLGKYYANEDKIQHARKWFERAISKGHEESMTAIDNLPTDDTSLNDDVKMSSRDQNYGKMSFI